LNKQQNFNHYYFEVLDQAQQQIVLNIAVKFWFFIRKAHVVLKFKNQILNMHVFKATIHDFKSVEFEILLFVPEIRNFFQKMARFFEQNFNFSLFYPNLNQQKITDDFDFRAPSGHESLWTTNKNSRIFTWPM
jgi:hypothetical protein